MVTFDDDGRVLPRPIIQRPRRTTAKAERLDTQTLDYLVRAKRVGERLTADSDPLHPGSIVMCEGLTGTAYQLFFNDDLFHSTGGKVLDLDGILAKRPYVVYAAPASL